MGRANSVRIGNKDAPIAETVGNSTLPYSTRNCGTPEKNSTSTAQSVAQKAINAKTSIPLRAERESTAATARKSAAKSRPVFSGRSVSSKKKSRSRHPL